MDLTIESRLARIEQLLGLLVERETVREWCRLGRVRAEKRQSGRGPHPAWVISHQELLCYRRDGLLVPPKE